MNSLFPISAKLKQRTSAVLLMVFCWLNFAAQPVSKYTLHAHIVYRIIKYVNWPEQTKSNDFVIGVVGNSPIYNELQQNIAGRLFHNRKIIVNKISSLSPSFNCQLLFVSEDESYRFKRIIAKTSKTPTLILSESEGLASEGSCINFIEIDERLKLEINKKNIETRNLKIATELLQLGIPVK